MATFSSTIKLTIDAVTGGASSAVKKLRADLNDADGAFEKTKVASSSLWTGVKDHAGVAVAGAATAIGAFAVKSVMAFQETALGAGKLRDSLGVTAEEASRLQEVAGDLSIPIGALESTIGRMNRTAGSTPEKFDEIGSAIARNADGTINVNETFLNTVDALNKIPDAAERAKKGQEIFGRSWMQISEMVGMGAEDLRRELSQVENQKIISDDEIAKARKFRDALDDLQGKLESITIWFGSAIVSVQDWGDKIGHVMQEAENSLDRWWDRQAPEWLGGADIMARTTLNFASATEDAADAMDEAEDPAAALAAAEDALAAASQQAADSAKWHADKLVEESKALQDQVDAARASVDATFALHQAEDGAREAVDKANLVLADQESTLREQQAAIDESSAAALAQADAQVEMATQTKAAAGQTITATQKGDIMNRSLLEQAANMSGPLRDALIRHIGQLNGIPEEEITAILADLRPETVAYAESELRRVSATRTAQIKAEMDLRTAQSQLDAYLRQSATVRIRAEIARDANHAEGGPVRFAGTGSTSEVITSERGAERLRLPVGTNIMNAGVTAAERNGKGGGDTYQITIQGGGSGADNAAAFEAWAWRKRMRGRG